MPVLSPLERDVLRRTDYRCHRCWTAVARSAGSAQWRAQPVLARARGGHQRVAHWLPVCSLCSEGEPRRSSPRAASLDREDRALLGALSGLGVGWLAGGPALALVGLSAGAWIAWRAAQGQAA